MRPQDLPPPDRMRLLPKDERGFIVPWFVAWMNETGEPVRPASPGSTPDFRIIRPGAQRAAHQGSLCWLCGKHLSARKCFVIGSMCLVNRVSSEPPSHVACAEYAARVCPFLTKPKMVRNTKDLPEGTEDPAGIMLERNPGVALLYVTRDYHVMQQGMGKQLYRLGKPERLSFYCQGRQATLPEIAASIRSGLPILAHYAKQDGAEREFVAAVEAAVDLVPGLGEVLEETAA